MAKQLYDEKQASIDFDVPTPEQCLAIAPFWNTPTSLCWVRLGGVKGYRLCIAKDQGMIVNVDLEEIDEANFENKTYALYAPTSSQLIAKLPDYLEIRKTKDEGISAFIADEKYDYMSLNSIDQHLSDLLAKMYVEIMKIEGYAD